MPLSNSKIKMYRSLQQKKYREKEGLFVIEGEKIVREAIKYSPHLIHEIVGINNIDIPTESALRNKVTITDYESIKKISSLKTPQKVVAILKKPHLQELSTQINKELILVLDDVSDPGNMGTIIRLADWFGIKKIICSNNSVDCYNSKVVQATMGGILRIDIYYTDPVVFISKAKQSNIPIYGAALDGENIYNELLESPSIIVMGNESAGISEEVGKLLTKKLLIPNYSLQTESSESLNVSTATAIVLGEFRRQQFYSK